MTLQAAAGDSGAAGPGDTASVDPLTSNVVDIFEAVDLPVIVVTTGCTVARFNGAAALTLNLTAQHVGRHLHHIQIFTDQPDVQKVCVRILGGGAPCRLEVRDGDKRFLLRIAAYPGGERPIVGAVLTVMNMTAFRASIEQAIYEREFTKAILNTVTEPLAVLDADLRVQTANRAFFTLFGISREEAQGRLLTELKHHDWNIPTLWAQLKGCFVNQTPFKPLEFDHEFPTVGRRTVWLDARRLHGEGNGDTMMLLTFRDITDEKKEEKARAHLAAIVTSSGDAIISKDLKGTIQSWNEGAQRLFGYTAKEIIGQPILRLIPGDRQNEGPHILETVSKGERIDYYETVRQRQDGSFVDVSLTVSPIRDGNGSIVGASKIARNITEQKVRRSQQHLLYELATSVNSAEALPDLNEKALDVISQCLAADRVSILLYDADDVMRFKAWRNLSDRYRRAVEGHSPWKRNDPAPSPIIISTVAECQIDNHLKQAIKNEGIESLAFFPLTYGGRLLGKFMVSFGRPYTMSPDEIELAQAIAKTLALGIERKQAEHALRESEDRFRKLASQLEQSVVERTARLRALATELSLAEQRERKRLATEMHDHLQQLLVLSKLKLGQSKRLAEALPACLDIIKQADEVLTQALTYTRTLVTELCPPILKEFGLSAAIKWLAEQMLQHQLLVRVEVLGEEPVLQEEHAVLLFQSVRELLINASKYADTGQASVSMRVENEFLYIEVRDSGKGFDLSGMRKLDSTSASSKFGLFSIRERMKALEGSLELESAEGAGTTAVLKLPMDKSTPLCSDGSEDGRLSLFTSNKPAAAPKGPLQPSQHTLIRVLLVDDHAMMRQGLRSVLEAYSDVHVVGEAKDGQEAIALVQDLQPDIVVMDINMPKVNGIEATAHIRTYHPETKVIGLSVNAQGSNQDAMLRAGAELLLTKEAAVDALYEAIQKTLSHATHR